MPRYSEVNFYLKKPVNDLSLIYLQFKYSGLRFVFSTGQKIDPDNWRPEKQRVKNIRQTTEDGKYYLNDLLESLDSELQRVYALHLKNGIPTPATLAKHMRAYMNRNKQSDNRPTLYKLIDSFIAGEIKKRDGDPMADRTADSYGVLKTHLRAFEIHTKYPIDFHTIDMNFYRKFLAFFDEPVKIKQGDFVYDRGVNKKGSVGNMIKNLKSVMNEAVERKMTDNLEFKSKKFVKLTSEGDHVYLTEDEILRLYRFDFSDNKRLEQVRDLFVFGCFVGLRYSDFSDVKPQNIASVGGDYFIKIIPQKTGDKVIIPCHPIVLEIFKKYGHNENRLPKALSNTKMNKYIKEACEIAGFTETGRLVTEPETPLFECITSHTCRRSFATNYFLQDFPTIHLMRITGHKTETAFLKYIKVTKEQSAALLSAHMKKNWSEKMLRVA